MSPTVALTTPERKTAQELVDKPKSIGLWIYASIAVGLCIALVVFRMMAPVPLNDEGGYINMLNNFLQTGRMDLMRWSQPTFLGAVPLATPLHLLGLDPMFSFSGIAACLITLASVSSIASRYTETKFAALLTLSLFAFPDFVDTAVTAMSDQYFLAYFSISLVSLQFCQNKPTPWSFFSLGVTFSLAALTRAQAFILPLVLLLAITRNPSRALFKPLVVLLFCVPLVLGLSSVLTEHKIPLSDITTFGSIIHGKFALFDIRATLRAIFDVSIICTPVSLCIARFKKSSRTFWITFLLTSLLCLNLFFKSQPISTVLSQYNLLSLFVAPIACGLLAQALLLKSQDRSLSNIALFCAAGIILVMPVMAHPMSRHAMPAVICLLVSFAAAKIEKISLPKFVVASLILALLVSQTMVANYNGRMTQLKDWNACIAGTNAGIPANQIFGGWNWFCYNQLKPGLISNYDYQQVYNEQKDSAPYLVTNGVLETRKK